MEDRGDDLLAELFSSRVRATVLRHLLPRPHLGFSLTDLSRALGLPISSLQHECYKLERIGVLASRRDGNARRYAPNPACPLLAPLTALVLADRGPGPFLAAAVEGVPGVETAFLAGTFPPPAAGTVRLVLVGEVPLEELDAALDRVAAALALPPDRVELAFFRPDDWRERASQANPYVADLLAGPRTDLLGAADRPHPSAGETSLGLRTTGEC